MTIDADALIARLRAVQARVSRACEAAARAPEEVTLIAVSKNHPVDALRVMYDAGVRDFGESYVQEWLAKADALPDDIRWHLIGRLQSNKAKLLDDRVHGRTGFHHQHDLARCGEAGRQFLHRVGAANGFALGAAGQKFVDLVGGAVVGGNGEAFIGHVQDQVFAHDGETNEAYVRKWFHRGMCLLLWLIFSLKWRCS